jgi:hypothetical protein
MESTSGGSGNLGTELRSDAATVANSATERLHSEVDARKGNAASQVRTLSAALNRAGEGLGQDSPSWLRSAFDSASQTVQQLADTVEQKDSRELTQEVQQMARRNPGSFLAACALAGFAAARVVQAGARASGDTADSALAGQSGSELSPEQPAFNLPATADPYVTQSPTSGAVL